MVTFSLVIVDMQNDFLIQHHKDDRDILCMHINALLDVFSALNLPIYIVITEHEIDGSDALLKAREENNIPAKRGSVGAQIAPELRIPKSVQTVVKTKYSAFFETILPDLMRGSASTLVVAGVNTHACVRTTVVDAYQRNIPVIIPSDAVASYDSEYHLETLRYLGSRIGRVLTTNDLILELRSIAP